ncbi:MAG: RNA 2',3'-cyclic phosphodiesterase [Parvularculaceae bacterium]|nr:RNA 2',3'-cyclic phosphodiesterase [Parvularculaceae bacterium]
MYRLFVALSLPEIVCDSLTQLQSGLLGARWTPDENMHLTLAFIGETDRHGLSEIDSALQSISARGFDLRLSGCDFFGDRKPRALWVGAAANPALSHVHAKVETALRRVGLDLERRKFTPHVTIAYLKGVSQNEAASFCAMHGLFTVGPFPVDAFHLYESRLGSEGAHYEILETYSLSST